MTDYISREAAIEALCCDCSATGDCRPGERCVDYMRIKAIPAADVREVVYCKDCRHRDPEDHKCDCGGTERQGCPFKVDDDYFCAYGEKQA